MLIKTCLPCKYHVIKVEDHEPTSHCGKENCWARYSKCILNKALERYLKEESSLTDRFYSISV